jgi:hypothetical protein
MLPDNYMSKNYMMEVNGMKAAINTPEALEGENVFNLPPYEPKTPNVVDEYKACPENWMHGSDKASSYFVSVQKDRGLWFDFTPNEDHTHHVAVAISVQGVNPVTGQKCTALRLEQYKKQCPIHKVDFQQDRYCPECGYKWPAQNYISTTTGQPLWLDGFRNENGRVRQYIITEEEIKGIASQTIGDDRVWAIGFAFYLSKQPKPRPQSYRPIQDCSGNWGAPGATGPTGPTGVTGPCGSQGAQGSVGAYQPADPHKSFFPPSNTISPSCKGMSAGGGELSSTSGHQITLHDQNTFVDLSQVPNKNSRYYDYDKLSTGYGQSTELNENAPEVPPVTFPCMDIPDKIEIDGTNIPSEIQCGFPGDDANSLQQLASGDANLDVFYGTEQDDVKDKDIAQFKRISIPLDRNEALDKAKQEAIKNNPQLLGKTVLDPNSFCPTDGSESQQDLRGMGIGPVGGKNIVFKRKWTKEQQAEFEQQMERDNAQVDLESIKKLEIGAGAKISQEIGVDPKSMDFWESEPVGMIYVNYLNDEDAQRIISEGKREETKDGFLNGLKVGN